MSSPRRKQYAVLTASVHWLWVMTIPYAIVLAFWVYLSCLDGFDEALGILALLYALVHFVCNVLLSKRLGEKEPMKLTGEEYAPLKRHEDMVLRLYAAINYIAIAVAICGAVMFYIDGLFLVPTLLLVHAFFCAVFCIGGPVSSAGGGYSGNYSSGHSPAAYRQPMPRSGAGRGKSFLDRVGSDNAPWEKHFREDYRYHSSICQHDDPYDCDDDECY